MQHLKQRSATVELRDSTFQAPNGKLWAVPASHPFRTPENTCAWKHCAMPKYSRLPLPCFIRKKDANTKKQLLPFTTSCYCCCIQLEAPKKTLKTMLPIPDPSKTLHDSGMNNIISKPALLWGHGFFLHTSDSSTRKLRSPGTGSAAIPHMKVTKRYSPTSNLAKKHVAHKHQ